MADLSPLSPDLPELRLVAQLAGVRPDRLAAALNDPTHWLDLFTADECFRVADGYTRLNNFNIRVHAALDVAETTILKDRST